MKLPAIAPVPAIPTPAPPSDAESDRESDIEGTKTKPMPVVSLDASRTPIADVSDVEDGSSAPPEAVAPAPSPLVAAAAPEAPAPNMEEMVFRKSSPEIEWAARTASSRPPPARVSSIPPDEGDEADDTDTDEPDADETDESADDDSDDAFLSGPPPMTAPQWIEEAAEDERPPPKRMSGRSVALALMAVTFSFAALALYARYTYRGNHDTETGLGLPLRDGGAAVDPSATSLVVNTTATVAPTAVVQPSATVEPVVPVVPVMPSATVSVAGTGTGTSNPVVIGTGVAHPVAVAPITDAGARSAPDASAVAAADSFTQEAQKALEKEGEGRSASRAAELAWKATKRDPSNAEAWLTLGAAYHSLGNKAQAQNAYRSCARQATGPRVAECRALAGLPPE